jgi:integrase
MESVIDRMRQDLTRAGYAKSTQGHYIRTATAFIDGVDRPVEALGQDDVRQFIGKLEAKGKSASWMKMHLAALVFLFSKTLGRPNEVSFISFPRQHSPLPTVLSVDEVGVLLEALHHRIYRGIALVLYGTGVRIEEALSLEVGDIDARRGVIHVRHGKGDKARAVKLTPTLLEWLRRYWAQERPAKPYLFASRRTGRPPTQDTVRAALAQAADEAKLTKRVTPVNGHPKLTHLFGHQKLTHPAVTGRRRQPRPRRPPFACWVGQRDPRRLA